MKTINVPVKISEFTINDLPLIGNILILGKENCGKTTLVKSLLEKYQDYPYGVIISRDAYRIYDKFIKGVELHKEYNSEIISNLLTRHKILKENEENTRNKIDKRTFIIFDEIDSKTMEKQEISDLIINGKCNSVTCIFVLRYTDVTVTSIRSNFDITFMMNGWQSFSKILWKSYNTIFENENLLVKALENLTDSNLDDTSKKNTYLAMVIKNKFNNSIQENIFWYRVSLIDIEIKIGNGIHKKFKHIQKIEYNKFDINLLPMDSIIYISGKRGSGRSSIVRELLKKQVMKYCSYGIVISPTEEIDPFYSKFIPKERIYKKFDETLIWNLTNRYFMRNFLYNCSQHVEFLEEEVEKHGPEELTKKIINNITNEHETKKDHLFAVFDDCLCYSDWKKNIPLREFIINAKKYNVTVIIVSQHAEPIEPCIRSNFDYVFSLADDVQNNIRKLYKSFGGCFPTFEYFKTTYQELTEDYKSMVIVNKGVHENIQDKIFWFKVQNC